MINIEGLDKAAVLAALYNNARVQGLGFLHAKTGDMSVDEARELLVQGMRFDYLHGRVMKVDLSGDAFFSPRLYDRDNGEGAARSAVERLRDAVNTEATAAV